MPTAYQTVDRWLVIIAIVSTAVLFTAQAADPVNVIKLTALLLCAIALLASVAVQTVRTRVLQVPWGVPAILAVALVVAFVVSTLAAPVTTTAVLGAYGRNSGLLAYLGGIVLFVVGLRVFRDRGARFLVAGVVAAGLFTATYGLFQRLGWDSVPWNNPFNPIIASLGNPNFAAGYLGIAGSVAAGGALWAGWAVGWRVICGVTAALCLIAGFLSSSVQGPMSSAGGFFVLAVAVLLGQPEPRRKIGLSVMGVTALVGGTALIAGLVAKAGPAAPLFLDNGSRARYFYWDAALSMFNDKPLLGVGLDQYGNFWRSLRSSESVVTLRGPSYSDAAHSVPLQMLAQGGLVLGGVYLAFIGFTLYTLVRGLLRLEGSDRMLLAAVGAGWVAYQVQGAVSIDQVPLLTLHFALAGGVIAAAGLAPIREVKLPGALKPEKVLASEAKTRRRIASAAAPKIRASTGGDAAGVLIVGLVGLIAAYLAIAPLRANAIVLDGDTAQRSGDGRDSLAAYDRAVDLVGGQAVYLTKKGAVYEQSTPPQPVQAQEAYQQAVDVDPYDLNALTSLARTAAVNGDLEVARQAYRAAARVDRWNPVTVQSSASFELAHDGAQAAVTLLEEAVGRVPGDAGLWATLGDARIALDDDVAAAAAAYRRALEIDPAQPSAVAGTARLVPS